MTKQTFATGPGGQMFADKARRIVRNEKSADALANLIIEAFNDGLKPMIERIEALEKQIANGPQTVNQSQGDDFWSKQDLNAPLESSRQEPATNKAQSVDWDNYDMNAHLKEG